MKKLIEKVLKSELIFQGRFLRVWRDEVELPNGYTAFREYIKHPGAAMVIPQLDNGKFVMIYQYRHSVGQVFLEFPAGKRDKEEDSKQTAARELAEEVGYSPGHLEYLTHIHPVIGFANERIDIYFASNLKKVDLNRDHDELLEVVELTLDEMLEKVSNHEVTDVKTQIGIFWLLKHLAKNQRPLPTECL